MLWWWFISIIVTYVVNHCLSDSVITDLRLPLFENQNLGHIAAKPQYTTNSVVSICLCDIAQRNIARTNFPDDFHYETYQPPTVCQTPATEIFMLIAFACI